MKSSQPLHERARGRWAEILTGIGFPESALSGRHVACPACGGTDRFRYLRDDDGGFFCSDTRGAGVELVKHFLGIEFKEAALKIEAIIGSEWDPKPREETYADRLRKIAMPSKRSAYLEARGLEVPHALRWCKAVDYFDGKEKVGTYPAMLAPITRSGRFLTFHVTYLGKGCKADVPVPRKVLPGGHISGGGIALYPAEPAIGVAEGIETAIAAKMIHGVPVHSAINATMLAKWQWPEGTEHVRIFADRDANYAGQAAAYQLAHRLALKGIKVTIELPSIVGDWNDVLLGRRAA